MRVEKTVRLRAPIDRTWTALLDPAVVGACIPGVEGVEAVDATHFTVPVNVKVGIVRARFTLAVTLTEARAPHYLRSEVVGEESGLASRLRQWSELHLSAVAPDATELRVVTEVDVFGRLGTFGASVLRGKADRMWDEFVANLRARIE